MGKNNNQWQGYRSVGVLFSAGATMAAAVLFGYYSGYYLDKFLGTKYIFTFVMFILGVAAGLKALYNMAFPKEGETGNDD